MANFNNAAAAAVAPSYASTSQPRRSMWGDVQTATQTAPGIWSVTTAGHGGIVLSPARNAMVPACLRRANAQYEEDGEYAAVVFAFPDHFSAREIEVAHQSLRDWRATEWEALTGEKLTPETSKQRAEAFWARHANSWVATSAFGSWAHWVPDGMVGVFARKGNPQSAEHLAAEFRCFLIPGAEYRAPRFVVDPDRHEEVPVPAEPTRAKDRAA